MHYATLHPEYQTKLAKYLGCEENELSCLGCGRLSESCWGHGCGFVTCCETHQVASCKDCRRFPCESLIAFSEDSSPHHHTAIDNILRMKELGVEKWIEEQEQRWACKNCGHSFRWYSELCAYCGDRVFNSVDEDLVRQIEEEEKAANDE
jgi:hypothetical protein